MFTYFKPVEKKQEAPHFEVVLDFMHGDADGYSDSVTKFETEEDVLLFLKQVDEVQSLDAYDPSFFDLAENLEISEDEAADLYLEILPRDIKCDDFRAQLCGQKVFYVDAQGVQTELIKI